MSSVTSSIRKHKKPRVQCPKCGQIVAQNKDKTLHTHMLCNNDNEKKSDVEEDVHHDVTKNTTPMKNKNKQSALPSCGVKLPAKLELKMMDAAEIHWLSLSLTFKYVQIW